MRNLSLELLKFIHQIILNYFIQIIKENQRKIME